MHSSKTNKKYSYFFNREIGVIYSESYNDFLKKQQIYLLNNAMIKFD